MTRFRFVANRMDGGVVNGFVEAQSVDEAAAAVSRRELFPTAVKRVDQATEPWWKRPSARQRAVMMQGLSAMVESAVPLERALEVVSSTLPEPLRGCLGRVAGKVREGSSLARAMKDEPAAFSPVAVGLVQAGERGAGLPFALTLAAREADREAEILGRTRSALAYPLVLSAVGMISIGIMLAVVIPRFADLLGDTPSVAPLATRALLVLSAIPASHAAAGLATAALALALMVRTVLHDPERWHDRLLRLPVIGSIRHSLATARACRSLGVLLEAGVPAATAVSLAADAVGDRAVAVRMESVRSSVVEGVAFSTALASSRALTPLAVQLAAIGEGSGRLAPLLVRAAELEENNTERLIGVFVAVLEPALILIFGALVAFVAAGILQGLYSVRPV